MRQSHDHTYGNHQASFAEGTIWCHDLDFRFATLVATADEALVHSLGAQAPEGSSFPFIQANGSEIFSDFCCR